MKYKFEKELKEAILIKRNSQFTMDIEIDGKVEKANCPTTNLRYYGKIIFDPDESLSEKALNTMPNLRAIYNNETGKKLAMCYLENATAEIRKAVSIIEKIEL